MTALVVCLIAGEIVLYLVLMAANRDRDPARPPPSLGRFYLLLCVGLFGMSGASFLTYLDTARQLKALDAAGVRYLAVRDVLGTLKDMEIGQRGYLLTGRPAYAEPYRAALAKFPARVDAVRALYRDADDEPRAEDLLKLAAIKAEEVRKALALREQGDAAGALAVLEGDTGKNTMDLFRISEGELARKNLAAYTAVKRDLRRLADSRIVAALAVMAGSVVQMVLVAFGRRRLGPPT
jgi:CHASE3 domain sensor protein